MDVLSGFNAVAEQYDSQRRQLLPCFQDFYTLAVRILQYVGESPRVLDIGGGTGLFSAFVLRRWPRARITLIDLSEKMLGEARKRFMDYPAVEYITADYTDYIFGEPFDIIISGLSIHHLEAEAKRRLYSRCFAMLVDGGEFVNADQALSPYPELERRFSDLWKDMVEASGLSTEEIAAAYERTKLDRPSTVAEQLTWLAEAGFSRADIVYKYLHFSVFYAFK